MKIQLDDKHYLNSDQYCYWITVKIVPEKGKAYERRVSGFTATFSAAVDSFIDMGIRCSQTESYAQLLDDIQGLKDTVAIWLDALGDTDIRQLGGRDDETKRVKSS